MDSVQDGTRAMSEVSLDPDRYRRTWMEQEELRVLSYENLRREHSNKSPLGLFGDDQDGKTKRHGNIFFKTEKLNHQIKQTNLTAGDEAPAENTSVHKPA